MRNFDGKNPSCPSSALRAPSPNPWEITTGRGEGLKTVMRAPLPGPWENTTGRGEGYVSPSMPRVRNAAESGGENEIWLYGEIYDDYWYEEYGGEVTEYYGIWTPKMIRDSLRRFGNEDVTIHIHSAGGYVEDASAIRAIITSHPGKVTCRINGLCASAAVMVAISGDRVLMQDSAYLMIHNPWTIALGDVDELKRAIKSLQASKKGIIEAYQSRCHLSAVELDKMMNDETWLTGQEALEAGFVDVVLGAKPEKVADEVKATTNRLRNVLSLFRHVPEDVRAMMDGESASSALRAPSPKGEGLITAHAALKAAASDKTNETAEGEDSALESAETEVEEATGGHENPPLLAETTDKERDEAVKALREKIKNILKEER